MITINASTITNNLLSNNKFSYKITKQGYAFNTDAEEYSYNAESLKENIQISQMEQILQLLPM